MIPKRVGTAYSSRSQKGKGHGPAPSNASGLGPGSEEPSGAEARTSRKAPFSRRSRPDEHGASSRRREATGCEITSRASRPSQAA
jgi:hypothetical protein